MEDLILLRVLEFFLKNPYDEVYLRELAKKLKLSPYAVKKYADFLLKKGLIKEDRRANLRYFKANINSLFYKQLKIAFNINLIVDSGLIDFLKENLANITSIVLFGSIAKGEDDENSDLDIIIIGKKKYLSLREFEEKLDREINIHVFSWSEWNKKAEKNKAFYYEVISPGIPLYGELPIVK